MAIHDWQAPDGSITVELNYHEAMILANMLSKDAAARNMDILTMMHIQQTLMALMEDYDSQGTNRLIDKLSDAITARWPEVHVVTQSKDQIGQNLGDIIEAKECEDKGHCACPDGDRCCFCNQKLTPDMKRRPGVEPKGSLIEQSNAKRTTPPILS